MGGSPNPLFEYGGKKITENRRRDKTLTIRLTDSEKKKLIAKSRKAKMSATDFIIACADNAVIKTPEDLRPVLVLAPHEGFIDSDLWIKCRERALDQQQIKRNPKAKNTWLAGLVKCGNCEYALVRKNYVKKNISYFLCSHKMNDNLCCGCGTIHADEFEKFILQKIKEKLADFKEFELEGVTANNPKIEELKARQIAIDNEINETVKNVAGASETVMAYINENVERLHSEKLQIQAEIQHLSENRYSANEKIICDFDKFDELPFERKRELANAVIKKIYATSDKIDIIWNI